VEYATLPSGGHALHHQQQRQKVMDVILFRPSQWYSCQEEQQGETDYNIMKKREGQRQQRHDCLGLAVFRSVEGSVLERGARMAAVGVVLSFNSYSINHHQTQKEDHTNMLMFKLQQCIPSLEELVGYHHIIIIIILFCFEVGCL
jgi:hypothetical protein